MIIVENLSRLEQTIALAPTPEKGVEVTAIIVVEGHDTRQRGVRKSKLVVGDSIRLAPFGSEGSSSDPQPDSVANDPTIKALERRGIVRVVPVA